MLSHTAQKQRQRRWYRLLCQEFNSADPEKEGFVELSEQLDLAMDWHHITEEMGTREYIESCGKFEVAPELEEYDDVRVQGRPLNELMLYMHQARGLQVCWCGRYWQLQLIKTGAIGSIPYATYLEAVIAGSSGYTENWRERDHSTDFAPCKH